MSSYPPSGPAQPPMPPEGPPPGPQGPYPPWQGYPAQWPPPPPPGAYPPGPYPPPPGWQPGAAWPPPPGAAPNWVPTPAGWRAPPPGASRRKLVAWIVTGVVAVVAAVAVAAVLLAHVVASRPQSDEAQIRALITKASSTDTSDISEFRDLWCAKIQHVIDQVQQYHPGMPQAPERPRGQITVKSIRVDGDRATATIVSTLRGRSRDAQMTFVKEDGAWKLCL